VFCLDARVINKRKTLSVVTLDWSEIMGTCNIPDTTGWSKKTDTQFYFWDNFGNSAPILTILLLLQAEMYGA